VELFHISHSGPVFLDTLITSMHQNLKIASLAQGGNTGIWTKCDNFESGILFVFSVTSLITG